MKRPATALKRRANYLAVELGPGNWPHFFARDRSGTRVRRGGGIATMLAMLTCLDRIQIVVADRAAAAERWAAAFGAIKVGEDGSRLLNAHRTTIQAGDSEVELLEPAGDGPIQAFAERWREGIYGAGFSTPDLNALARNLDSEGFAAVEEQGRLYLTPGDLGMPTVLSQDSARERVGTLRHIYEVTNPVPDWKAAAHLYTRAFGLDASRYSPIHSDRYGYSGTLTLFDPPAKLDRIEITQTFGGGAMDRFFERRGASLYMCYAETDDVLALAARLESLEMRYAAGGDRPTDTGLFVHPRALNGMLMGVSRTDYAWAWSGHPELAGPGADAYSGSH